MVKSLKILVLLLLLSLQGCSEYDSPKVCQSVQFSVANVLMPTYDLFSKEFSDLGTLIQNGNVLYESKKEGSVCKFRAHISGQINGNSYDKTVNFEKNID